MQKHPHEIIMNQKFDINSKLLMLLTQLILYYRINCNTKAIIVILSHKKIVNTYSALIDNYEKISFVLVMYVLLSQFAFF